MATIIKTADTLVTRAQAEKIVALGLTETGTIEYGADDCRARWTQTGDLIVWVLRADGSKAEWMLAESGDLTVLCVECHLAECRCYRGGA